MTINPAQLILIGIMIYTFIMLYQTNQIQKETIKNIRESRESLKRSTENLRSIIDPHGTRKDENK